MPYSGVTGRYYQTDSDEFPRSISRQQLFVLYAAANYQLRPSQLGWCADRPGAYLDWIDHSQVTVRCLLKKGLLEGNARGENLVLEGWDGKSMVEPPIPKLWTSAKGKKLLDKITSETGIVFDRESYQLVKFETDPPADGICLQLGNVDTPREFMLAYDRAAVLIDGDDAETNFPPEESKHVVLPDEVMRQINALKAGRGRLQ